MRKIKKINELFDDEELYSKSEVPYLTGEVISDLKDKIRNGEIIDFKSIPKMARIVKQLHMSFPFVQHSTGMGSNDKGDSISFAFTDGEDFDNGFIFNIVIKDNDKYDLIHGVIEDGEEYAKVEKNLDYKTLFNMMKSTIYPNFKKSIERFKEEGIEILMPGEEISNFSPDFNSVIYTFEEFIIESNKK